MNEQTIVALCMGLGFMLIGILLMRSERFARWGLNHGKARIWIRLLGEDRAMKLTRIFLGPLTIVLGILCLLIPVIDVYRA